jgi:hypothetical protein
VGVACIDEESERRTYSKMVANEESRNVAVLALHRKRGKKAHDL